MTQARSGSLPLVLPGAAVVLAALVQAAAPAPAFAQGEAAGVTFSKDVAPILQRSCQVCHRPGSIGPMSLLSYADARRWSALIRTKVAGREMPPYQYDRDIGT